MNGRKAVLAVCLTTLALLLAGCSAVTTTERASKPAAASSPRADEVSALRLESRPPATQVEARLVWQDTLAGPMTYEEARQYVDSLEEAEEWDWRLPTYWELQALADEQARPSDKSRTGQLYVKEPFRKRFEDIREPSVWAYGTRGKQGEAAVCFDFASGGEDASMKTIPHYVLAVRDVVD